MTPEKLTELYESLLSTDDIKASWLLLLWSKHQGRRNAIPRIEFLQKYCGYDLLNEKDQTRLDREFRRFYAEEIPAATCPEGVFWPISRECLEPLYEDLKSKIIAMRTRWKYLSEEHRDLLEPGQMELPLMEEGL